MQARVVSKQPVVTQRHILLLPLLVQGFATPFQQDPLRTEVQLRSGVSLRVAVPQGQGSNQRPAQRSLGSDAPGLSTGKSG